MEQTALKQSVEKMGIYELRQFARQMGVPSPTTKKRDELIFLIEEYSKKGSAVQKKSNKKGRPPKTVKSVASYFDMMVPDEFKSYDEFSSNILVFRDSTLETKSVLVEGYLQISESGYYYLDNKCKFSKAIKVFIPEKLVINNFVVGDYIKGYAVTTDDKCYGMLENTNGTLKMPIECSYDDVCEMTNKSITAKVNEGDRVLVETSDIKGFFENALTETSSLNGYEVVYLGANLSSEVFAYARIKLTGTFFLSTFEDSYKDVYENCKIMIDYVKSLVCHGKKVLIYVSDIVQILDALDFYFASNGKIMIKNHTLEAIEIVKQIFAMGRCVKGGASASLIASVNDLENEFVKNNLKLIATKTIKN